MKKTLVFSIAVAALAAAGAASGAPFASKPIRVIHGAPAGSSIDNMIRVIAEKMRTQVNQVIVIESRAGAAEVLALNAVAQAEPDGNTLFWGTSGLPPVPILFKASANLDVLKEVQPVALTVTGRTVFIVNAKTPYNSVEDLVNFMRKNPGKINFAIGGGPALLHTIWFQSATKTDFAMPRYSGGATANQAVMSGESDVTTTVMGPAIPARDAGMVKIIAITTNNRTSKLHTVPALGESSMPEIRALGNSSFGTYWLGFFAPIKTPRGVVNTINDAVARTVRDTGVAIAFSKQFDADLQSGKPEELRALFERESAEYRRLAKAANIQPQ